MNNTALETQEMLIGETRRVSVNFAGKLDDGELLTGTPIVTPSPTGPTISGIAINASAVTISGKRVEIGEAVQFTLADIAEKTYTLTVTAETDAGQTLLGIATLIGVTD